MGQGASLTQLTRASAVSASGPLSESQSRLPRGSSGSSDSEFDLQQLDQRGMAYYFDRDSRLRAMMTGTTPPTVDLIRFDPLPSNATSLPKG
jgi:hypothetical protein